jgi:hypothetical protein
MKTTLIGLLLTISTISFSQTKQFFNRTIGVDLLPMILIIGDGGSEYNEVEFIFTEQVGQKIMRFKLNFNNRNPYGDNLINAFLTEDSPPEKLVYHINEYRSDTNIKLVIGLTKSFTQNSLNLYYGADVNMGMNRGWINTFSRETKVNAVIETSISSKKESIIFLGLTPVLGLNLPIGQRILFGLELGLEFNYLLKPLQYLDTSMIYQEAELPRLDFNALKLINDFSVRIRF